MQAWKFFHKRTAIYVITKKIEQNFAWFLIERATEKIVSMVSYPKSTLVNIA